MSTLVYVGANTGYTLWSLFDKFDSVYAFEPDPEIFSELERKYRQFEWVTLINAACSIEDGEATFYVTGNRVASSLGDGSEAFKNHYGHSAEIIKEITVKTINLSNYLKEQGVDFIDLYFSDAQGSDLNILKTMKNYIDNKKIGEMFIETHGDGSQIYCGLVNNYSGFKELLSDNYEFIHACMGTYGEGNASASRVLIDGQAVGEEFILDVGDWGVSNPEWDTYWRLKGHTAEYGLNLRS